MTAVRTRLLAGLAGVVLLASCSGDDQGTNVDPAQVDAVETPELGACRVLTPQDVAQPSNATRTVPCSEPHTAETYAVGQLPAELDDVAYDDEALGRFAYSTCSEKFEKFVGGDESLVMRSVVSWAWFRPSETAWDDGARWYRCDIVGGGDNSAEYVDLPPTSKGLLQGKVDDKWLVCADGATVSAAARVPCSEPHSWRAVTTIKLGEPEDDYPGDRVVEVRTRDFCDSSVGAVLGYPVKYDFAYTWFHEAEWEVGNRRSVCWAKTDR
ncbi:septum formation family protein [Nocardioides coralli]|uniref:septum formation family protein n=1 Tax=Nocardioides coralli TaxID=2872154 RepID=UPI001CA4515C|nr:septum formation family protein [Nocardioides coralli]QZY30279.1 septum formation family protein [Nocardioides coralli]